MADLINRPAEFYVGLKEQYDPNDPPLAFLTPFDTTAAFKKRKETVDTWAQPMMRYSKGQNTRANAIPARNVLNEPVAGFKIAKSVKRTGSWNGGNVVWRIEDPRGFEWEIPSPNLAQIISQTGISAGGTINGRCIIARIGSSNILVPEGTDLWDQMEADMKTRAKKATLKPISNGISIGDVVKLKDGETGYFMGRKKLMMKIPSNPAEFDMSKRFFRAYTGGFDEVETEYEYFLFLTSLSDYNWKEEFFHVRAYRNSPFVEVPNEPGLTINQITRVVNSKKLHVTFAGKPKEISENLHGKI